MENGVHSKWSIAKKILKIVFKILYQIFMVFCALLILIIVFQKVSDNNKSIAGYRIFRVITGSMEPEYDIGQVVISKEMDPNEIKVGDDIVYLGKVGEYNGKIIMHEVVQIDKKEDGSLNFHAKGLHSTSVEDPLISSNQIYGVVKVKSAILTLLYKLATSIYSSFIIITVLVLNVFISFRFPGSGKMQQLSEYTEDNEDEEDVEEYEEEFDVEAVEEDSEEDDDESNSQ